MTSAIVAEAVPSTVHYSDARNVMEFEIYKSPEEIAATVGRVALQIQKAYDERKEKPLLACVLNGAKVFMNALTSELTALEVEYDTDSVRFESYRGTASSGEPLFKKDFDTQDLENRWIIFVEDIVETGNTISAAKQALKPRNPGLVQVVSLFYKPGAKQPGDRPKLVPNIYGMAIDNDFIVGYGLDFEQWGRDLPAVYKLFSWVKDGKKVA